MKGPFFFTGYCTERNFCWRHGSNFSGITQRLQWRYPFVSGIRTAKVFAREESGTPRSAIWLATPKFQVSPMEE